MSEPARDHLDASGGLVRTAAGGDAGLGSMHGRPYDLRAPRKIALTGLGMTMMVTASRATAWLQAGGGGTYPAT